MFTIKEFWEKFFLKHFGFGEQNVMLFWKCVTFRRIDENLHLFEDPQAEQPLSGDVSFFHHL